MTANTDRRVQVRGRFSLRLNPPLIALLLSVTLFVLGGLVRPGFANAEQAANIIRLAAFLGIIGAGQTLVIIGGGSGIDLSVGAVVTLAAILFFRISDGSDAAFLPALGAALAVGALVGLLNGLGITLLKIPPLVMTLAMTGLVAGTVRAVTRGELLGGTPPLLQSAISDDIAFGLSGVVVVWLVLGVLLWVLLERTVYGKQLVAIGVNRTTARLSGVRVNRVVLATYVLSGLLAAFSGVVLLGFTGTVFLNLGAPYLFPSIAAVVIGGTALAGGRGSYWGTMAGALMLTLIQSLLRALGVDEAVQLIVQGAILLALLSVYGRERQMRI
jgi:ribose transport system permease protein